MKLALGVVLVLVAIGALVWWSVPSARVGEVAMPAADVVRAAASAAEELPSLDDEVLERPASSDEVTRTATLFEEPVLVTVADAHSTLLKVRVVARESGAPVTGERLFAKRADTERWSAAHVAGSHAARDEVPLTDADGRAEFELEPGVAYRVGALRQVTQDVGTDVAALTAGEVREIVLELATEPDLVLFARVLDGESGAPLSDAAVHRESRHEPEPDSIDQVLPRGVGLFELRARSWQPRFANATAGGHARSVFAMQRGHETPDTALEIRLWRAATLELVVRAGGLAASDAKVELTTKSYHLQQGSNLLHFYFAGDPHWNAVTDASGRAEVGELPPRVPLTLTVHLAPHAPRTEAEPIILAPGEHRRVELSLGTGAAIVGRVEDSSGEPVAGCEIWRVLAESTLPTLIQSYEEPVAREISDARGSFRFDDVPAGTWLIGPPQISEWDTESRTADALSGLAQPVRVEPSSAQIDVVVRVDRGLYVSGTVIDSDGAIAPKCGVRLSMEGTHVFVFDNGNDDSGEFKIGPLPAGRCTLHAGGMGDKYAQAEPVEVDAGASDVVLRVQLGGVIRGRIVDASGRTRECQMTLANVDAERGIMMNGSRDGVFEFNGLLAGAYTVSATTGEGLFGSRGGLVLGTGGALENIEIVLGPGATLKLRYDGEHPFASMQIAVGGNVVGADGVQKGTVATHVVPTGEVEVRWRIYGPDGVAASERVTLAAGEEREVVWDGKP